jgi:hypothetical protein
LSESCPVTTCGDVPAHDADIRAEVREDVLLRDLLIGPIEVTASVHGGVVTLTGAVDAGRWPS